MSAPLRLLWVGAPAPPRAPDLFSAFVLHECRSLEQAALRLGETSHAALVLQADALGGVPALLAWQALSHAVLDAAVVVLTADLRPETADKLIQRGVQNVLPAAATDVAMLARVLHQSVARKRIESAARKAYATDLATGLPNHAQLLEHMSHLLALREREPAPMALLVLRIEGLATTEAALGAEAANILRRKVAVRLRAGLRASDVVASIGADAFAVLLAWIDAPEAGHRVAAKLVQSLQRSFNVAGQERAVAVSAGVSQYPENGRQADELLRRAMGQATALVAVGRAGFAAHVERGPGSAANDEGPDTVL